MNRHTNTIGQFQNIATPRCAYQVVKKMNVGTGMDVDVANKTMAAITGS